LLYTDPTYFAGHAASVNLRIEGKQHVLGQIGILHPSVLKNFELNYPVTVLEMNLELFL